MNELPVVYHQKVLILGLAKSGVAAANALRELGAFVTVNDLAPLEQSPAAQQLLRSGVHVICGSHPPDLLDEGFHLVVKNPGIPYSNPVVQDAIARGIPVWTEVELAYRMSEAPMIGITGSNGKTTTTMLLFDMLEEGGCKPLIAGNIGTVACAVAREAKADEVIVTELSSFQLMGTEELRPRIAILTNLHEAHLDYHGDFASYAEAKFRIAANQTADDWFIYNAEQPLLCEFAERTAAKAVPFSARGRAFDGISADDTTIYWRGAPLCERAAIRLPGRHNAENALAATAAALLYGASPAAIERALRAFTGVRHRSQFVRAWRGRDFYNDSKATNALATKSALSGFDRPVILLAGGVERGLSFEALASEMDRVKGLIAFGETAARLETLARRCGVALIRRVDCIEAAVSEAVALSETGDVILLSPACASWDQYESFEERGDRFIAAVEALAD